MRRYFRPTGFVETPVGYDGQVARLAGGMCFFALWEVIEVADGRRVSSRLVTVGALEARDARESAMLQGFSAPRAPLRVGPAVLRCDAPEVLGILNLTPDSFSDGGKNGADACAKGAEMAVAGAKVIDVGGESTRPGASEVWDQDEIARIEGPVEQLSRAGIATSIDTRKVSVMRAALAAGAGMINDVAALGYDGGEALAAATDVPVVIMASADPVQLHRERTGDVLIATYDWLEARIAALGQAGVSRERIVVDPGIGFGLGVTGNLALINGLSMLHGLGCPIMLGASRKRLIGALDNERPADARLGGSVALALTGAMQGVQLIRAHDVAETVQALRVWRGLRDQALTAPLAA